LPPPVIERAKEILARLEGNDDREHVRQATVADESSGPVQMALFTSVERRVREELERVDVTRMTPVEALNLLAKLSEEAKK
jgi:DNA mismatch repair protein MutS